MAKDNDLYKRVPGKTPVDVYHGTSSRNLGRIKEFGLKSPERLHDEHGIKTKEWPHFRLLHVSTQKADTKEYATAAARADSKEKKGPGYVQSCADAPDKPVVLKATLPRGKIKATHHTDKFPNLGYVPSGHIPPGDLKVVEGEKEIPLNKFAFRDD